MLLESMSICSKSDLSELNYLLSKKIPTNHFIFIKGNDCFKIIFINKRFKKSFYNITARWLNKILYRKQIEEVLRTHNQFLPEEHLKLCHELIDKMNYMHLYIAIWKKMSLFFKINKKLNLDGFITFGLKEYNKKLNELVKRNLNRIITENNYNAFINILKTYIETEESLIKAMHIEVQPNGGFKFYDDNKKDISKKCVNIFKREFGNLEEKDDLLLSTLIIFLPEKIYIYKYSLIKNKNIIYTLNKVFGEKIIYCNDTLEL